MHPIFRSKSTFLTYVAAWVPLGLMYKFIVMSSAHFSGPEILSIVLPLILLLAFVCLWPWLVCRVLSLKSSSAWAIVVFNTVLAMLVSAGSIAAMHLVVSLISRMLPGLNIRFESAIPALTALIFLTYVLSTALHYVVLAVEASRQAEILSREAQLKALKAQVNPHFLFNSLNSISALTAVDPAKAREMCVRLADFLRNSLRLGERVSIPFAEELALAKAYLDVEQIRFGERLQIRQDFQRDCGRCEVPPLLLQPIVENAIKHGIATLVDGGEIGISGRAVRQMMRVVVENPFDPDAPATGKSGFGLVNVRNRLQARYGTAARLDVEVDRNHYRVVLSVPCETGKE